MSDVLKLGFCSFAAAAKGVRIVFCDDALKCGPTTCKTLGSAGGALATNNHFTGKSGSALELILPEGLKAAPPDGDRYWQDCGQNRQAGKYLIKADHFNGQITI